MCFDIFTNEYMENEGSLLNVIIEMPVECIWKLHYVLCKPLQEV